MKAFFALPPVTALRRFRRETGGSPAGVCGMGYVARRCPASIVAGGRLFAGLAGLSWAQSRFSIVICSSKTPPSILAGANAPAARTTYSGRRDVHLDPWSAGVASVMPAEVAAGFDEIGEEFALAFVERLVDLAERVERGRADVG